MRLSLTDLFRARWTDRIHDEWINALKDRPDLDRQKLERTRSLMNAHVRSALARQHLPETVMRLAEYEHLP